MKILFFTLGVSLILVCYWIAFGYYKITISGSLVKAATPFSIPGSNHTKTMLVLGDSTAVGVGAKNSSTSVPGLMSTYLGMTYVENRAVSGSLIKDIHQQMESIQRERYDVILLQIGANDIVRFHKAEEASAELEPILTMLTKKTTKVIFITAGNVGGAPLIPPPLRPFYKYLSLDYHKHLEALGKKTGVMYINLYQEPSVDPFIKDPKKYFAEDSFHPSSDGYSVWFTTMKNELGKQ